MQKQLECIKIKDGLYLGNIKTAQDAQFLVTNKFAYIVNCSAEIANFYEGQGIKYLKYKLVRNKPHKMWDESLKKISKLDKFIQTCQQNSMCCLIHSFDGVNRSLVMLVAFLMSRYRWRLGKTLEFVRSKQIFIGLSEHYISQLEKLQKILQTSEPPLTSQWRIQYRTAEEQVISKTFLNSQQIQVKQPSARQKKNKRVVWKDLVEKQRKKQQRQLVKEQQRQRGIKIGGLSNEGRTVLSLIDKSSVNASLKQQKQAKQPIFQMLIQKKKAKSDKQSKKQKSVSSGGLKKAKIGANRSKPEIASRDCQDLVLKSTDKYDRIKIRQQEQSDDSKVQQNMDDDQLLALIKNNLKSKKKIEANCLRLSDETQQKVYNVTINNFIKPNINILNKVGPNDKKKTKKRPQSAWKKSKPL